MAYYPGMNLLVHQIYFVQRLLAVALLEALENRFCEVVMPKGKGGKRKRYEAGVWEEIA